MSTASITHRPIPMAAAGAAVAAVLAFAVVTATNDSNGPGVPGAPTVHQDTTIPHHHFHPTTSGGKVQTGP